MVIGLGKDAGVSEIPPEGSTLHFLYPVAAALTAFPVLDDTVTGRSDGIIGIDRRVVARLGFSRREVTSAVYLVAGEGECTGGTLGSAALGDGEGRAVVDRIGGKSRG